MRRFFTIAPITALVTALITALITVVGVAAPPGPALAWAPSATASSAFDTPLAALKSGQWIWDASIAPAGPIMVIIDLKTQLAFVYRNGVRIGVTTISSGKAGKTTPTGIFTILQKHKDHKSNRYNSAPMPYMQRLTWDGIALHAGNLPGYPASHGCIRMPLEFSKNLYEVSTMGMTVVVSNAEENAPSMVVDNGLIAAVDAKGQPADPRSNPLSNTEISRWSPDRAPTGPVTIVVSTRSKLIIVYRNGIEIGRSRIGVPKGFDMGTRAAQFAGRDARGVTQWVYLGLPGYQQRSGQNVDQNAINKVQIPPQFYANLHNVVGEGTTLLATNSSMVSGSTGTGLTVLTSD
jgi:lipoprotein-anchoring transpeptidase ErfK/SrfK